MRIGIPRARSEAKRGDTCGVLWRGGPVAFWNLCPRLSLATYLRKHFPIIQGYVGELAS